MSTNAAIPIVGLFFSTAVTVASSALLYYLLRDEETEKNPATNTDTGNKPQTETSNTNTNTTPPNGEAVVANTGGLNAAVTGNDLQPETTPVSNPITQPAVEPAVEPKPDPPADPAPLEMPTPPEAPPITAPTPPRESFTKRYDDALRSLANGFAYQGQNLGRDAGGCVWNIVCNSPWNYEYRFGIKIPGKVTRYTAPQRATHYNWGRPTIRLGPNTPNVAVGLGGLLTIQRRPIGGTWKTIDNSGEMWDWSGTFTGTSNIFVDNGPCLA